MQQNNLLNLTMSMVYSLIVVFSLLIIIQCDIQVLDAVGS